MIYLDAGALLKFIRSEPQSAALREWRVGLPTEVELITSELARLEVTRTLIRVASIPSACPTSPVRRCVTSMPSTSPAPFSPGPGRTARVGSDPWTRSHLAGADPFRTDLRAFAGELGFPVLAP